MAAAGRKPPAAERLALAAQLLDEGWPFQEIVKTHGLTYHSLAKNFPGRQWTNRQAADHGILVRKLNKLQPRTIHIPENTVRIKAGQ
jgi:hypothetical protein